MPVRTAEAGRSVCDGILDNKIVGQILGNPLFCAALITAIVFLIFDLMDSTRAQNITYTFLSCAAVLYLYDRRVKKTTSDGDEAHRVTTNVLGVGLENPAMRPYGAHPAPYMPPTTPMPQYTPMAPTHYAGGAPPMSNLGPACGGVSDKVWGAMANRAG